ncbi:MAG: 3'(2'),5'-bisphosphate nucleotidase CysQ [Nitratireductor sp.]
MDPAERIALLTDLLPDVIAIARQAGEAILDVYGGDFEAREKADASPVTDADEAAEALIVPALKEIAPDIPVVAEEAAAGGDLPDVADGPFWLVDPLDGTKEFLSRNGEFTVNIALIDGGRPALGVVLAPAVGALYAGVDGLGATRRLADGEDQRIAVRTPPAEGVTVIASRRHGDPEEIARFLGHRPIAAMTNVGSSLKFCKVAAGEADVYPRFGRTMEWDTAAGQAVLVAAGGLVTTREGATLGYAKNPLFENPHFVAWGGLRP